MSDHMMDQKERVPSHPRPPPTTPPPNSTTRGGGLDDHCSELHSDFDVAVSVICGMLLLFGIVYSLFGYRCFKAVMFLTGFIFGSVVVYLICLEENLLPALGNAGVAVGAGVLFGLITMLVQYVGLFMTGFHTGLLAGVVVVGAMDQLERHRPATVWVTVGVLVGCGLVLAVLTLHWQKGLTVVGTSVYGGALVAATLDYFVERFATVLWIWDKVKVTTPPAPAPPCWFGWLLLAVWPFVMAVGVATQFAITGKGTYHQELIPPKKTRPVPPPQQQHHLQQQQIQQQQQQQQQLRVRTRQTRESQKQRRYRYLYQVRTAHGDVISQSYIQSLQGKASPSAGTQTTRSNLTQTSTLNPSESTTTTMSHVP